MFFRSKNLKYPILNLLGSLEGEELGILLFVECRVFFESRLVDSRFSVHQY